MKNKLAVWVLAGASIGSAWAAPLSPDNAKKLAVEALQVINEIEPAGLIAVPQRIDQATWMRKFDAPVLKIQGKWPSPWWDENNKAIEPYQTCLEAIDALDHFKMLRVNNILPAEQEKSRAQYFSLKSRCEKSIKTGKPTPR